MSGERFPSVEEGREALVVRDMNLGYRTGEGIRDR